MKTFVSFWLKISFSAMSKTLVHMSFCRHFVEKVCCYQHLRFQCILVYFCCVVVLKRFSEYPGTLWAESIPHLERPVIRLSPQISLQQRSKTPLMSLSRNSHPNLSHIRNIPVGLTLKTDITVILISHSLYLHPFKLAYDMPHIPQF